MRLFQWLRERMTKKPSWMRATRKMDDEWRRAFKAEAEARHLMRVFEIHRTIGYIWTKKQDTVEEILQRVMRQCFYSDTPELRALIEKELRKKSWRAK